MEDVEINHLTYNYLVEKYTRTWKWQKALEIEQEFSFYRAFQELEGVDIDVNLAINTLSRLDEEIEQLDKTLTERIPNKILPVGNIESGYKPFKKNGEYNEATKRWFN